jgi:redox-sensitive bicupin YhaK (pirin superfamily)
MKQEDEATPPMSTHTDDPGEPQHPASASVEALIQARPRDLGGFSVKRLLPWMGQRRVGPFVFFDHMGPATFSPGRGIDVRPHPHIALATVTYLFDGEIVHRDSLGKVQPIRPGDVNWMVAGRGIVHSERSGPDVRRDGAPIHGIQSWVALPLEHEEAEPSFEHSPSRVIPSVHRNGVTLDVIAGTAYGERSPVGVLSPTLYVHARLDAGTTLDVDDEHAERAAYVVEGSVRCDGNEFTPGTMLVLRPRTAVNLEATQRSRVMLVGGASLPGERHIYWNFVSSSKERIERAKDDWKNGRFPRVPGDDVEFIPLPLE